MDDATEDWLHQLLLLAAASKNGTTLPDAARSQLRRPLAGVWPLLALLYGFLVLVGGLANATLLGVVVRRPDGCAYVANLAVANLVQCGVVLPASLAVLLLQNWIFGRALCYCMPMIQDIPLHVTMLTFLLIAADRYRLLLYPCKPRIPACECVVGTWLLALCIVVPYPFYITYIDLGMFGFDGMGLCIVNLVESMQEYMRGLFLLTYILPLSTMAYLYVRVSQELKIRDEPPPFTMRDVNYDGQGPVRHSLRMDELMSEVDRERRSYQYLASMVTAFAMCMCPLMVLRVVKLALVETYANSAHYDVTYTLFVWFAFLHTISTPSIFALWTASPETRERYLRIFQLNRQRHFRRRGASAVVAVISQQSNLPDDPATSQCC